MRVVEGHSVNPPVLHLCYEALGACIGPVPQSVVDNVRWGVAPALLGHRCRCQGDVQRVSESRQGGMWYEGFPAEKKGSACLV